MEVSPYLEFQLHKSNAISSACQMVSLYYALPKEKVSDCQKFDMSVRLIPRKASLSPFSDEKKGTQWWLGVFAPTDKMDEDEKVYKLRIDVL